MFANRSGSSVFLPVALPAVPLVARMVKFIFRRLLYGLLVLFGVIIVVFLLFQVLPGDPVALMAGQKSDVSTREAIAHEFGLDKPLPTRLLQYLGDLSPVSVHTASPENQEKYRYTQLLPVGGEQVLVLKAPYLRRSFQTNRRVGEILLEDIEGTVWLALAAIVFATVLGITFGIVAALRPGSFWDHFLVILSVLGISVPSFVAALLISQFFGNYLGEFTGLNTIGSLWETDVFEGRRLALKNLILPTLALGIRPLAIIMQLTRSAMLEVMAQDYVRTARAKGLTRRQVVLKHALKNALNPVITAVSGWLASLLAGAFFIEKIFYWKGLGRTTIDAIESKDFPVVMGATLFVATIFVLVNILVDILYSVIDPRVRLH